jgi:germination protein M
MKRITCTLLALALAAVAVTACAPTPKAVSPAAPPLSGTSTAPAAPAPQPSVSPTSTTPTRAAVGITVFFAHDEKMQAVQRWAPAGTEGVLRAALTALLAGPTKEEKAAGLATQIPPGTRLRDVTIRGNVAVVDLTSKFSSGGGTLSMTNRLAQVVFTATEFKTIAAVAFRINGHVVTVFGGEGIALDHDQTRSDFEGATPAILVDSPAWGGPITEGATMRGTANVFEATFKVQLRDSYGTLLFDATVKASSGTGTRGVWSAKATLNHSIAKTGALKVFDASAKDGKPENVIEIPVVLKR